MKSMSNIGKFFVICAIAFTLGLVMTIGGCAAGGADGIEKAVDGNDWSLNAGPVETEILAEDMAFSSIEATGEADLMIVGSKYYDDAIDEIDDRDIEPKAGKVVVIYDKSKNAPEVKTEGDKLIIDAGKDNNVYFGDGYKGPKVIVFCDDKELGSITVSSAACDLEIKGVRFRSADLGMNAGDVDMKDIISGGLRIIAEAGDVEISGVLRGITDIKTEAGSVEIDVFEGTSAYTMDLHTDAGDIEVGKEDIEASDYTQKGGEDTIKVRTDAGDIEIGDL